MSGIDNIIQKINQDNQEKIDKLNEQTAIQINEIKTLEGSKAQEKVDEIEKINQKLIAEVERNAVSAAQMKNRQELLKTRQEALSKVFDKTVEAMKTMDDTKRTAYIKSMVVKSAFGVEKVVATRGDSIFTDSLLSEINAALIANGKKGELTYDFTDEKIDGVLLNKDGMTINLTYSAVIDELKTQMDTDVAKILFEI